MSGFHIENQQSKYSHRFGYYQSPIAFYVFNLTAITICNTSYMSHTMSQTLTLALSKVNTVTEVFLETGWLGKWLLEQACVLKWERTVSKKKLQSTYHIQVDGCVCLWYWVVIEWSEGFIQIIFLKQRKDHLTIKQHRKQIIKSILDITNGTEKWCSHSRK